jgi:hypothetical protein
LTRSLNTVSQTPRPAEQREEGRQQAATAMGALSGDLMQGASPAQKKIARTEGVSFLRFRFQIRGCTGVSYASFGFPVPEISFCFCYAQQQRQREASDSSCSRWVMSEMEQQYERGNLKGMLLFPWPS